MRNWFRIRALELCERKNFSEGCSVPKKDAQVIRVWGPRGFVLELLVSNQFAYIPLKYTAIVFENCANQITTTKDGLGRTLLHAYASSIHACRSWACKYVCAWQCVLVYCRYSHLQTQMVRYLWSITRIFCLCVLFWELVGGCKSVSWSKLCSVVFHTARKSGVLRVWDCPHLPTCTVWWWHPIFLSCNPRILNVGAPLHPLNACTQSSVHVWLCVPT